MDEQWNNTISNEEPGWWQTIDLSIVHKEIKNLPDGCRQVFNLYVLEDFSHKDIASNLGISESTSKSQYHRARQLLKERIIKQIQVNG
ncbi:RNA polymerase sigma factor [compost metagenome]